MTTIVNIFGKLYTFLRRPQTENENQSEAQSTEGTSKDASNDKQETKVVDNQSVKQKKESLQKVMTDSAVSSDWEHIQEGSSDSQMRSENEVAASVKGEDQFEIQPHVLNCSTQSGTDIDAIYTQDFELKLRQGEISKEEMEDVAHSDMSVKTAEKITPVQETGESGSIVMEIQKSGESSPTVENSNTGEEKGQKNTKRGKDKKVCKYYRRGQKCWKGSNCNFMHSREEKQSEKSTEEFVPSEIKQVKESDFDSFLDYVSKSTELGRQIDAKDLFYKLGYEKGADTGKVGEAVIGQYQMAKSRNNWQWVKEARYFAQLFFAPDWIDEHLPHRDQKSNRKNRPKKKEKFNPNEHFESPSGLCKDFRLKENPDMQTVVANAAGDSSSYNVVKSLPGQNSVNSEGDTCISTGNKTSAGKHENADDFITDYTEQVIQEAMKMAISDGLSESAILEVIEDVTSADRNSTPLKRVKPTKVDLSRTPRSRPDQLALGFNYHSDLVVKQSPKTVRGEIIPLDTLPQPRERQEQLAVGFNYLAEQLVKESPRSETGEVIIPGVVTTPRRLARDQLAIGFNYHSDLIAKDSPTKENLNENGVSEKLHNEKNNIVTLINGTPNGQEVSLINGIQNGHGENIVNANEVEIRVKSAKRSISDTFAVGFSYNSDHIIKESLDEVNGNLLNGKGMSPTENGILPNGNTVGSLIEDAVIGEGRNNVEVASEIPATGLPAGSVW